MFELLGSLDKTVIIVGLGAAMSLLVFVVLGQFEEKAALRSTLRQLDDYEVENIRDQELLVPLQERVFSPVIGLMQRFGGRFNPPDYVESVRKKHVSAGITSPDKVERFLAMRIIGFVSVPIVIAVQLFWNPLGIDGWLWRGMTALLVMIGAMGPTSQLNKKVDERQKAISKALPDVMDLLVISVEAGLGFEQALDRVITNVPGELSDEFARVLGESRAGSSRADALRAMDERCDSTEVRSFVLAMIQADTFGVSIGRVLRSQSDELRVKRRQKAQEQAQKAPVKMMIPMVFCIFPALFVVVIGPAAVNISENF